jgi:hypothetical protein
VKDAARVHARDGAAAGAERVDIDARQRHLAARHALVTGEMRLARFEQGDVRARPAHVEGNQVPLVEETGRVAAARNAACRPG